VLQEQYYGAPRAATTARRGLLEQARTGASAYCDNGHVR